MVQETLDDWIFFILKVFLNRFKEKNIELKRANKFCNRKSKTSQI